MTTAIQAPKRPRGPRKPVLNAAMIQRAQELMAEHRAAEQDLVAATQGKARITVDVSGRGFSVLASGLATLLAKDVAAIEAEAKRLGVVLKEPAPAPLLTAIKDAGGAVPDDPVPPALPGGEAV